jgi:hypothetical protein
MTGRLAFFAEIANLSRQHGHRTSTNWGRCRLNPSGINQYFRAVRPRGGADRRRAHVLCEINVSSAFAIQIGLRRKSLALRMPDCRGGSVSRDEDPIYRARYLECLLEGKTDLPREPGHFHFSDPISGPSRCGGAWPLASMCYGVGGRANPLRAVGGPCRQR